MSPRRRHEGCGGCEPARLAHTLKPPIQPWHPPSLLRMRRSRGSLLSCASPQGPCYASSGHLRALDPAEPHWRLSPASCWERWMSPLSPTCSCTSPPVPYALRRERSRRNPFASTHPPAGERRWLCASPPAHTHEKTRIELPAARCRCPLSLPVAAARCCCLLPAACCPLP